MTSDVFTRLDEIARELPPERWMLVGGLMVHAHAQLAGLPEPRPTDDADLVVELRAGSYAEAANALQALGYLQHESLDPGAPLHRFRRGSEHVDLMGPEGEPVRFAGRSVLGVPGARSALRRTILFQMAPGTQIRIPDLASALSLKGAAYYVPGPDRVRHLQDGVTLFACADRLELRLSTSMRKNVNALINALSAPEAWAAEGPTTRRRALRAILAVRPDWVVPGFVLPRRGENPHR